jgi:hypothetical protein
MGSYHVSKDDIERNRPILATIPGCVKAVQTGGNQRFITPFETRLKRIRSLAEEGGQNCPPLNSNWIEAADEAFHENVRMAAVALKECFAWKDSMFARTVAANKLLTRMGLSKSAAMIALLINRGQMHCVLLLRRFFATHNMSLSYRRLFFHQWHDCRCWRVLYCCVGSLPHLTFYSLIGDFAFIQDLPAGVDVCSAHVETLLRCETSGVRAVVIASLLHHVAHEDRCAFLVSSLLTVNSSAIEDMRDNFATAMSHFTDHRQLREALIASDGVRPALVEALHNARTEATKAIVVSVMHRLFDWLDGRDAQTRSLACNKLVEALNGANSTDSFAEAARLLFSNQDLNDSVRSAVCESLVQNLTQDQPQAFQLHAILDVIHSILHHETGRSALIGKAACACIN